MALADSGRAIGAVTRLLREHLIRKGFGVVTIGKPEQAASTDTVAKLNLFLYEASFDASLRNVALREDQPPPLWLSLRYLLTAFDGSELSDSAAAHELLGQGLSALQEMNYLRLDTLVAADVRRALENNPEPIKLTFDEASPDLLSKIMQGTDEKYRLSVAFQVRPVMIVPGEPPTSTLLVGVDYTQAPPAVIGDEGVVIDVLATLGPRLDAVDPDRVEPGEQFEIRGEDVHVGGLECLAGVTPLSIVGQRPDRLTVIAEGPLVGGATEGPIAAGHALSAGELPLVVRQPLPSGRFRSSNLLALRLLPIVAGATIVAGDLQITGTLLGTVDDDVIVSLYREGGIVRSFDVVTAAVDQKQLTVALGIGVPAGDYLVILRVNGQQARRSPRVTLA